MRSYFIPVPFLQFVYYSRVPHLRTKIFELLYPHRKTATTFRLSTFCRSIRNLESRKKPHYLEHEYVESMRITFLRTTYKFLIMLLLLYKTSFRDLKITCSYVSYRKAVLKNLSKVTTPLPGSLFNKIAGLQPAISFKYELQHRCFHLNFAKLLRPALLQSTSGNVMKS